MRSSDSIGEALLEEPQRAAEHSRQKQVQDGSLGQTDILGMTSSLRERAG